MAGEESRKRTRGSQQSSSGAAGPAPDPLFNPLGDYDLSMLRKRIDTLAKAQELRDPIRRFAGESQSRIEQDLLMLQRGIGSKEILRRWAIYKKLVKLRKARKAQRLWPAQEAELQALQQAARDAIAEARIARADDLMQQVRDFGRYPKASKHVASRERRLAQNLREARKEKQLSPEQESELKVLQQAEMDSSNGEETEERRHLPEETNNGRKSTTPLQRKKEYNAAYYQYNARPRANAAMHRVHRVATQDAEAPLRADAATHRVHRETTQDVEDGQQRDANAATLNREHDIGPLRDTEAGALPDLTGMRGATSRQRRYYQKSKQRRESVSYTHLTLPTILRV